MIQTEYNGKAALTIILPIDEFTEKYCKGEGKYVITDITGIQR